MTKESFLENVRQTYSLVRSLSEKNDTRCLLVEHREQKLRAVLKILPERSPLYEYLSGIVFPNLPYVLGTVPLDDGEAVFEEYIDGLTVGQILDGGVYSYRGAKRVMSDVLSALEVIHSAGFVHRDVKPENVMVSKDGRVVLIDFNVSRSVKGDKPKDTVIAGTIGYMSPEQYGVAESDPRADIYSAGVLLNVMLTGRHPSEQLARGRAKRIVEKCCHIDPDQRYKSAAEMRQAL